MRKKEVMILISIHAPRMGSDSKHGEKSALFAFVCCAK